MKDNIYNNKLEKIPSFYFGHEVANVFDDMIYRSVPFYKEILKQCASFSKIFYKEEKIIYDLGCSTGSFINELIENFSDQKFNYIGVDNSKEMLEKAYIKFPKEKFPNVHFIEDDVSKIKYENSSIILSNYLMQFIQPKLRNQVIQNIYNDLEVGGVFLMSEKILSANEEFITLHHNFKKEMGYSDLEIYQKREALKNVLIPYSIDTYIKLLKDIGFKKVETFFQWYNFASFIAKK